MGTYSWMYADTQKPMCNCRKMDSFLLVPPEFQDEYGESILEEQYEGYGIMGGYDIYELVAEWNREYIDAETFESDALHKPKFENYYSNHDFVDGKLINEKEIKKIYEYAIEEYNNSRQRLRDFCDNKGSKYMEDTYGEDWKRNVGIDLAGGSNEDNAKLHYPIKITAKPMDYHDVEPIDYDPDQGVHDWFLDEEEIEL